MIVTDWLRAASSWRLARALHPFWAAALLSAAVHGVVLGAVTLYLPLSNARPSRSLPMLLVQFGDADRQGMAVDAVAPDPGTLRPGDADTPGGDGAKKPPDEKPLPVAPAPIAPPPTPADPPKADPPAPAVAPKPATPAGAVPDKAAVGVPTADARPQPPAAPPSPNSAAPGAPGGSRLPPGTPSAGGKTVGSSTGVRLADAARPPAYPSEAREEGLEGTPVIWLRVSADGDVLEARIDKSCGHKILDDAALRWARSQKFIPAYRDGLAVEAEVAKPVRFYLY